MKTSYRNCVLLNGHEDMVPTPGMSVVVENGRIAAVAPDSEIPTEGTVIDLQGAYLMPGLINLHIHIPASGKPSNGDSQKKLVKILTSNGLMRAVAVRYIEQYMKTALYSGCTTIRAVGGVADFDTKIRERVRQGKTIGPRMLVANSAITVPGGHMAGTVAVEVETNEEARAMVHTIAKDRPNLIKLMITGGVLDAKKVGEPGVLRMPPEMVKACCEEAHQLGFTVAAHVESPEGVKVALANGVDTIEHGAHMDEEMLQLFKDTGAKLVTTLSPALPLAEMDPALSGANEMTQANGKIVFEGIVDCCIKARANGIPTGLGTDTGCPFVTHYDMWRELAYFVKYAQATPTEALHTATLGNAQIVGIEKETGSIDVGKSADFIVSKNNPLDNFANLRELEWVVMAGKAYEKPQIKKMPNVEAALDPFCS